jgi:DNA-binding MarR family transcriptional regulator
MDGVKKCCGSTKGWVVNKKQDALTAEDYQALAELRYTLRQFMDFSTSAAQAEGLPSQQHQALLAIKGQPGRDLMTIGVLASRLLIAPHTATELVDRLDAGGLVRRLVDPTDKRRQTLELTEKANDLLEKLSSVHLKEIRELAPELIGILKRLHEDH